MLKKYLISDEWSGQQKQGKPEEIDASQKSNQASW